MSVFQYLLIYIGIPLLVSLISLTFGFLLKFQKILPSNTELFYFGFFGLLIGIGVLMLYLYISTREKYLKKINYKKQLSIPSKKELPISYSNSVLKLLIMLVLAFSFLKLFFKNLTSIISQYHILIPCIIVIILLTILVKKSDESKGSVLIASKLFAEKFNNIKEFKDVIYNLPEKSTPFSRSLYSLLMQDLFMCKIVRVFLTSLNFNYSHKLCTIGTTDLKIKEIRNAHNSTGIQTYNYSIKNIAFLEIEHSIPFKYDITIVKSPNHFNDVINDKAFTPIYKKIGAIYCSNLSYAEKILTEQVQLYLAELRAHFRNFSVLFTENQITISIKNAKWSSWVLRTFFPNIASKRILKTTTVMLEYLTKISSEIEKNQQIYN